MARLGLPRGRFEYGARQAEAEAEVGAASFHGVRVGLAVDPVALQHQGGPRKVPLLHRALSHNIFWSIQFHILHMCFILVCDGWYVNRWND